MILLSRSSCVLVITYHLYFYSAQEINYDSPRGGVSVITEKGEQTTSYLLIQRAQPADSGKYTCHPSNANTKTVTVHVLENGAYANRYPHFAEVRWYTVFLYSTSFIFYHFIIFTHIIVSISTIISEVLDKAVLDLVASEAKIRWKTAVNSLALSFLKLIYRFLLLNWNSKNKLKKKKKKIANKTFFLFYPKNDIN